MKTTVALIGLNSIFSRISCLLLKQSSLIKCLKLYDETDISPAQDVSCINTNCRVEAYSGKHELSNALKDADIVVIGESSLCTPHTAFDLMAPKMNDYAKAIAHMSPNAIIVVAAQPVNKLVPLLSQMLIEHGCYDCNKVLGATTADNIRANCLLASYLRTDCKKVVLPVIGGSSKETRVPLFSQAKPDIKIPREVMKGIIKDIKNADTYIFDAKKTPEALNKAHSLMRFLDSIVSGLRGDSNAVNIALTRTSQINGTEFFSLPVILGRHGISRRFGLPKMKSYEEEMIHEAIIHMNKDIETAINFYSGKDNSIEIASRRVAQMVLLDRESDQPNSGSSKDSKTASSNKDQTILNKKVAEVKPFLLSENVVMKALNQAHNENYTFVGIKPDMTNKLKPKLNNSCDEENFLELPKLSGNVIVPETCAPLMCPSKPSEASYNSLVSLIEDIVKKTAKKLINDEVSKMASKQFRKNEPKGYLYDPKFSSKKYIDQKLEQLEAEKERMKNRLNGSKEETPNERKIDERIRSASLKFVKRSEKTSEQPSGKAKREIYLTVKDRMPGRSPVVKRVVKHSGNIEKTAEKMKRMPPQIIPVVHTSIDRSINKDHQNVCLTETAKKGYSSTDTNAILNAFFKNIVGNNTAKHTENFRKAQSPEAPINLSNSTENEKSSRMEITKNNESDKNSAQGFIYNLNAAKNSENTKNVQTRVGLLNSIDKNISHDNQNALFSENKNNDSLNDSNTIEGLYKMINAYNSTESNGKIRRVQSASADKNINKDNQKTLLIENRNMDESISNSSAAIDGLYKSIMNSAKKSDTIKRMQSVSADRNVSKDSQSSLVTENTKKDSLYKNINIYNTARTNKMSKRVQTLSAEKHLSKSNQNVVLLEKVRNDESKESEKSELSAKCETRVLGMAPNSKEVKGLETFSKPSNGEINDINNVKNSNDKLKCQSEDNRSVDTEERSSALTVCPAVNDEELQQVTDKILKTVDEKIYSLIHKKECQKKSKKSDDNPKDNEYLNNSSKNTEAILKIEKELNTLIRNEAKKKMLSDENYKLDLEKSPVKDTETNSNFSRTNDIKISEIRLNEKRPLSYTDKKGSFPKMCQDGSKQRGEIEGTTHCVSYIRKKFEDFNSINCLNCDKRKVSNVSYDWKNELKFMETLNGGITKPKKKIKRKSIEIHYTNERPKHTGTRPFDCDSKPAPFHTVLNNGDAIKIVSKLYSPKTTLWPLKKNLSESKENKKDNIKKGAKIGKNYVNVGNVLKKKGKYRLKKLSSKAKTLSNGEKDRGKYPSFFNKENVSDSKYMNKSVSKDKNSLRKELSKESNKSEAVIKKQTVSFSKKIADIKNNLSKKAKENDVKNHTFMERRNDSNPRSQTPLVFENKKSSCQTADVVMSPSVLRRLENDNLHVQKKNINKQTQPFSKKITYMKNNLSKDNVKNQTYVKRKNDGFVAAQTQTPLINENKQFFKQTVDIVPSVIRTLENDIFQVQKDVKKQNVPFPKNLQNSMKEAKENNVENETCVGLRNDVFFTEQAQTPEASENKHSFSQAGDIVPSVIHTLENDVFQVQKTDHDSFLEAKPELSSAVGKSGSPPVTPQDLNIAVAKSSEISQLDANHQSATECQTSQNSISSFEPNNTNNSILQERPDKENNEEKLLEFSQNCEKVAKDQRGLTHNTLVPDAQIGALLNKQTENVQNKSLYLNELLRQMKKSGSKGVKPKKENISKSVEVESGFPKIETKKSVFSVKTTKNVQRTPKKNSKAEISSERTLKSVYNSNDVPRQSTKVVKVDWKVDKGVFKNTADNKLSSIERTSYWKLKTETIPHRKNKSMENVKIQTQSKTASVPRCGSMFKQKEPVSTVVGTSQTSRNIETLLLLGKKGKNIKEATFCQNVPTEMPRFFYQNQPDRTLLYFTTRDKKNHNLMCNTSPTMSNVSFKEMEKSKINVSQKKSATVLARHAPFSTSAHFKNRKEICSPARRLVDRINLKNASKTVENSRKRQELIRKLLTPKNIDPKPKTTLLKIVEKMYRKQSQKTSTPKLKPSATPDVKKSDMKKAKPVKSTVNVCAKPEVKKEGTPRSKSCKISEENVRDIFGKRSEKVIPLDVCSYYKSMKEAEHDPLKKNKNNKKKFPFNLNQKGIDDLKSVEVDDIVENGTLSDRVKLNFKEKQHLKLYENGPKSLDEYRNVKVKRSQISEKYFGYNSTASPYKQYMKEQRAEGNAKDVPSIGHLHRSFFSTYKDGLN